MTDQKMQKEAKGVVNKSIQGVKAKQSSRGHFIGVIIYGRTKGQTKELGQGDKGKKKKE